MCLFYLLETTSLNEFITSLPRFSVDILKNLGNIAKKTSSFLRETFRPPVLASASLAKILSKFLATKTLLEILPRYLASFWPARF